MILAGSILLWLGALVRILAMTRTNDRVTRLFMLSALCVAAALTARAAGAWIDQTTGVPNLYHLIQHVFLLAGGYQVFNFVTELKNGPGRRPGPVRRTLDSVPLVVAVGLWTTFAWFLAPIHDVHLPDPIFLSGWDFLVYTGPFGLYMATCMISTAIFNYRNASAPVAGTTRDQLGSTRVSLTMIATGLLLGVLEPIAAVVWSALPSLRPDSPATPILLTSVMYTGAAMIAVGTALGPIAGVLRQLRNDRSASARLQPLWAALVARFPARTLGGTTAATPWRKAAHRLIRQRIEILDCLGNLVLPHVVCQHIRAAVDPPAALAAALAFQLANTGAMTPIQFGQPARALLAPSADPDQELASILEVADRFRKLQTSALVAA